MVFQRAFHPVHDPCRAGERRVGAEQSMPAADLQDAAGARQGLFDGLEWCAQPLIPVCSRAALELLR